MKWRKPAREVWIDSLEPNRSGQRHFLAFFFVWRGANTPYQPLPMRDTAVSVAGLVGDLLFFFHLFCFRVNLCRQKCRVVNIFFSLSDGKVA